MPSSPFAFPFLNAASTLSKSATGGAWMARSLAGSQVALLCLAVAWCRAKWHALKDVAPLQIGTASPALWQALQLR